MVLNIGRRDVLDAGKEPEGSFEYFCQLARPADGQVRAPLVQRYSFQYLILLKLGVLLPLIFT